MGIVALKWVGEQVATLIFTSKITSLNHKINIILLKRKVDKELNVRVLKKYGNQVYYNHLDGMLKQYNIFSWIFDNCYDTNYHEQESLEEVISYYSKIFIEKYPQELIYEQEVKCCIREIYMAVFKAVNNSNCTENVRIICKHMSEGYQKLNSNDELILKRIKEIGNLLSMDKDDVLNKEIEKDDLERYRQELSKIIDKENLQETYIERNIYSFDKSEKEATEVLLENKKILLLGEAGCGKTYESKHMLMKSLKDIKFDGKIPVYLPLIEYGRLYNNLLQGLEGKIGKYIKGINREKIINLLRQGSFLLVIDGIDDIGTSQDREKCILEIKEILDYSIENYFFITVRANRYHKEFDEVLECRLKNLSRYEVIQILNNEGIYVQLPEYMYELLGNPLYLKLAKQVLRNNESKLINRSNLYEKFIEMNYIKWEEKKGLYTNKIFSFSETLLILGELAYTYFNKSSIQYSEFDRFIVQCLGTRGGAVNAIKELLSLGILVFEDTVYFVHKSFKEFLAAYYLTKKLLYSEHEDVYHNLILQEEWKEVCVFIASQFDDIQFQDRYLEYILENNLPLFIECVKAKNDIINELEKQELNANRFLNLLFSTYTKIIDFYFPPIKEKFDPMSGRCEKEEKKIGLVGCMQNDGERIRYFFDRVGMHEPNIIKVKEEEFKNYVQQLQMRGVLEGRNTTIMENNLKLSGLMGDSARYIAIDKIRGELKRILEKRQLHNDQILVCQQLNEMLKRIRGLDDKVSLKEIRVWIDGKIKSVNESGEIVQSFIYNGIDLCKVKQLVNNLLGENIDYESYLIPDRDIRPCTGTGSAWVWEFYSEGRVEEILDKYFLWHQMCYCEMVEKNFPQLCNWMNRYNAAPYRTKIFIKRQKEDRGYMSEPMITYYNLATEEVLHPDIECTEKEYHSLSEGITFEIDNSYSRLNRPGKLVSISSCGVTHILQGINKESPLRKYVYDSIRQDLEIVLGKF